MTAQGFCRAVVLETVDFLSETPDVGRRWAIAALVNDRARSRNPLPCQRAVQSDAHEPAWAQQPDEDAPPCKGVAKMMQNTDGLDDIEAASETCELEYVGLAERDVPQPHLVGFPLRVR